jgi:DNA gyrase subunit A
MHRFRLDEVQTEAVLETKLYRLSQLEIEDILEELAEREKRATELRQLLDDETARKRMVREELRKLRSKYLDERRTTISGPDPEHDFSEEDYILKENVFVIVSRDGWVKRQKSYTDIDAIRVREGDQIGWALGGSTRATVCFLTNFGRAYTTRIDQLPNTTGYGDPVQKLFDFSDKETLVGVLSLDERVLPKQILEPDSELDFFAGDGASVSGSSDPGPFFLAMTASGLCARFSVRSFIDQSTRSGRLFMRLGKGDRVLGVELGRGDENACLATHNGRALIFPIRHVSIFKGASKGVIAIRLDKDDELIGFTISDAARQGLRVKTSRGREETIRTTKFEVSNRGNKGRNVISRGKLSALIPKPVEIRLKNQQDDEQN